MFEDVFVNSGPLLNASKLAPITTLPQWNCDEAAIAARNAIKLALDKHLELLKADAGEPQTKFFLVNPTLHALGYVYSVGEATAIHGTHGDARARVEYTLFPDAAIFDEAVAFRGGPAFFRQAVAICQVAGATESLDLAEDPEVAAQQAVVVTDLLLRSTGVDFGIVTNGLLWRLVHRPTADRFTHYVEFDLKKIAQAPIEQFKLFYLLFGTEGLRRDDEGLVFVERFVE